jgi:multidrug efflux pump
LVEVTAPRAGPPTGKPIQVQLSAINPDQLPAAAKKVAAILATRSDIRDLDDGQPLPGIDWKIEVDKAEAAKYGAGVGIVGTAVQLVTNGVKITEYRPSDSDKAVDIIVRFPQDRRSLDQIDDLRVQTTSGSVPIGNFVSRSPSPRVGYINRIAASRVMTVSSNVAEGVPSAKVQQEIARELAQTDLGPGLTWKLKGEDEERAKASAFLLKAFATAMFLIFAILLAQFNKLTSVMLVLTAIVLSTIGVLLGLLIMGQAFGVVMTGIGIIANAGVIVNNNIVLIDTYDRLRREGKPAYDAIIATCRERARPVVLTAITAILGVLPIAFGMNLEFLSREITVGAPSTQWWINLSTAIVFGLGFATILTLIVTPAALMAIANLSESRARWVAHMKRWISVPTENYIQLSWVGIATWSGQTVRSWKSKLPRMK